MRVILRDKADLQIKDLLTHGDWAQPVPLTVRKERGEGERGKDRRKKKRRKDERRGDGDRGEDRKGDKRRREARTGGSIVSRRAPDESLTLLLIFSHSHFYIFFFKGFIYTN